jgi:hypothetical protein
MLGLRPQLLEGRPGIPADAHRQVVLVRHAVLATDRGRLFDDAERGVKIATGNAD